MIFSAHPIQESNPPIADSQKNLDGDGGSPGRKKVPVNEEPGMEEDSYEDGEDTEEDQKEATPEVPQDRSTQTVGGTVKVRFPVSDAFGAEA
eukprot:3927456-Rhodomonas_salina.1